MLEGDSLDVATEERMALVDLIEGGVQFGDDGLGFVSNYDHFDIDFLVLHRSTSACDFMPRMRAASGIGFGNGLAPSSTRREARWSRASTAAIGVQDWRVLLISLTL